jgi:hypothetical protein
MTREEKNQAVEGLLARYRDVGATVVHDDQCLCRLLSTLHTDTADRAVGEYLCSFLTV